MSWKLVQIRMLGLRLHICLRIESRRHEKELVLKNVAFLFKLVSLPQNSALVENNGKINFCLKYAHFFFEAASVHFRVLSLHNLTAQVNFYVVSHVIHHTGFHLSRERKVGKQDSIIKKVATEIQTTNLLGIESNVQIVRWLHLYSNVVFGKMQQLSVTFSA
jgi:hypothetical protein